VCLFCGDGSGPIVNKITPENPSVCHRGTLTRDKFGNLFGHQMLPPPQNYCVHCGAGAPKPKTEPETPARPTSENFWCDEHGWHRIVIAEDGTPIYPDCNMFKKASGPP
jgi:hypothetical protein